MKVGIIGCGNVTVNDHAPALRRLGSADVVAVADPVSARRRRVLDILNVSSQAGFETHTAMLAAQPLDHALVAVPPAYRREIISDCARLGVHVLAEKPLATRPVDARVICEIVASGGLKLGIVHNYMYYPEYRLLRDLIAEGAIGAVRHIALNFLGVPDNPGAGEYRPQWRHDPEEAGGGVLMDMIHAFYLAETLMGAQAQAVSAVVDNLGERGEYVEDLALVHLYFDRGYATINMGWGHGPGGVEVSGAQGRILVFYHEYGTGPFSRLESFTLVDQGGRREFEPRKDHAPGGNFLAIHENFVEVVRHGAEPTGSADAGCRSLEAAMAAYISAVEGRVVTLPLAKDHPAYLEGVMGLRKAPQWSESPLAKRALFGL